MRRKISNKQIREIETAIEKQEWEKAEKRLTEFKWTNDGRVYYLLGKLYNDWQNPKKDINKAKSNFKNAIDSKLPNEDSYVRLAILENNKEHAKRVLKKGLLKFPDSESIFYRLIISSSKNENEAIFKDAVSRQCISERIQIHMALTYYDLREFDKSISLLDSIQTTNEKNILLLKCIKGFAFWEKGEFENSLKIFRYLVEDDIG